MKNCITTVILAFLTTTVVMADSVKEQIVKVASSQDTKVVTELREIVSKLNEQLSEESEKIRLFAQLADIEKSEKAGYQVPSNKVVKVLNSESWPDSTVTSYIVLVRNNGTIAASQEVPVSESGDWHNTYTHYFDEKGNTIAFQRYSSFFIGCPDSPSYETSTYYYKKNRLIAKNYSLKGEGNKALKPSKCDFMYRHDYTIRTTWAQTKRVSGFGQAW